MLETTFDTISHSALLYEQGKHEQEEDAVSWATWEVGRSLLYRL